MSDGKEKQKILSYNANWMDRVFNSKAVTESLLAPERDKGNITFRDYDASLQFLPGIHRYYTLLFSLGAIPFFFLPGPKKWRPQRRLAVGMSLGMSCYILGRVTSLSAHFNYLRSLENPEGFARAMENIQKQLNHVDPPGLIIPRPYEPLSANDGYSNEVPEEESSFMQASDSPPTQKMQSSQPIHTSSKWDEIRQKNNPSARSSSWDALRQKHEKRKMDSEKNPDEHESFWSEDGPDNNITRNSS